MSIIPQQRQQGAYESIITYLRVVSVNERGDETGKWRCPGHNDCHPSLSVSRNDEKAQVRCWAGCDTTEVMAALGLELRHLYDKAWTGRSERPEHAPKHSLPWTTYTYCGANGSPVFEVVRVPQADGSKKILQRLPGHRKFGGVSALPPEQRHVPYLLPKVIRAIEREEAVWIAEGEKDVHALCDAGVTATCNAGGAGEWTDLHSQYLHGAHIVITRDQDEAGTAHQLKVAESLGGIAASITLVQPATADLKSDAADHFAAGYSLDDFHPVDTEAEAAARTGAKVENTENSQHRRARQIQTEGDPFADSPISERVVTDVLKDRWLYTKGLGWMEWTGMVWAERPEVAAAEVVRRWVDQEVARIALEGDRQTTKSASALQAATRIKRILELCRGQVLADIAHFDRDPDILVCGNGVVDLRTENLMRHDPSRLVTRMTEVSYLPDSSHPDWTTALEAVPEDVRAWVQLRLGQSATGHTPDDDRMTFLLGSGENGKTTLLSAAMSALGGYSGLVPDRLLLASADAHPTEMMSLRGLRMAVIEETPEGRRLSVARLKKTVGTPWITARLVYRDSTSFKATHALFLSSNYRPVIEETDHGTWRRLGLVNFPFRFMKPGRALTAQTDRYGDPRLRSRLHEASRQQAILAWLVRGAQAWYQAGQVMPSVPARIERDTLAWRSESDSVLAYATERLVPDPASHVLAKDLLADLNQWLEERGQQPWSDRTAASRFSTHEWVTDRGIEKKQVRHRPNSLSRSHHLRRTSPVPASYKAWTGVRFRDPAMNENDVSAVSSTEKLLPMRA